MAKNLGTRLNDDMLHGTQRLSRSLSKHVVFHLSSASYAYFRSADSPDTLQPFAK